MKNMSHERYIDDIKLEYNQLALYHESLMNKAKEVRRDMKFLVEEIKKYEI